MKRRLLPDRRDWDTVRLRLLSLAFLPVIAVAVIALLVFGIQTRPAVMNDYEREFAQALTLKSNITEMWISQRLQLIEWLGKSPDIITGGVDAMEKEASRFTESFDEFDAIVFVDSAGTVLIDSAGRSGGFVGDRDYYHDAMQGRSSVRIITSGRTTGRPYVIFSAPISSPENTITGVVFSAVAPTALESVLDQHASQHGVMAQLQDEYGTTITTFDRSEGSNVAATAAWDLRPDSGVGVVTDESGRKQLVARQTIGTTGWQISAQTPVQGITSAFRGYNRTLLIACLVLIIVCAGLTLAVTRTIERPLFRLDRVSRDISAGDYQSALQLSVPRSSPIELRRLHQTVHDMAYLVNARQTTLQTESLTDPLTGLANRRMLETEGHHLLASCLAGAQDCAVLIADLDHFKVVNDTHGHQLGDTVLVTLARIMKDQFRATDLVARYGGEEFVAILPKTDRKTAWTIAERVRRAVENHRFSADGLTVSITISAGLADARPQMLEPTGERSALHVAIAEADAALYRAKNEGRNRVRTSSSENGTSSP